MIAILCPTRGRPEQCRRMIDSVYETTSPHLRIILGVNHNDLTQYKLKMPLMNKDAFLVSANCFHDNLPTVHKWNLLAQEAMKSDAKLFMLGSDDMYFATPGWNKAIADHYNALENKIHVYALQDSRDENGTPHPIVTREWIEAMGYAFPPIFMHWYLDSWTVEIAKANDCFTHMKDYLLVHDKPSDRGQGDETHSRIRSFGWYSRDEYVDKTMKHVLEGEKRRLYHIMHRDGMLLIKNEDMDRLDPDVYGYPRMMSDDGRQWPRKVMSK